MINNNDMQNEYQKPSGLAKITKKQVLEAMQNGAILTKTYCVYSYWSLTFEDGTKYYNLRKDATNGISNRTMSNIVLLEANKERLSYKMVNK